MCIRDFWAVTTLYCPVCSADPVRTWHPGYVVSGRIKIATAWSKQKRPKRSEENFRSGKTENCWLEIACFMQDNTKWIKARKSSVLVRQLFPTQSRLVPAGSSLDFRGKRPLSNQQIKFSRGQWKKPSLRMF